MEFTLAVLIQSNTKKIEKAITKWETQRHTYIKWSQKFPSINNMILNEKKLMSSTRPILLGLGR